MTDNIPEPPFIYEGVEPVAPETHATVGETVSRAAHAVGDTLERAGDTWDRARKPGMPLSVISNVAREAPLGSLLVAFLLGVAFARRR
jgi:hypothetical protein